MQLAYLNLNLRSAFISIFNVGSDNLLYLQILPLNITAFKNIFSLAQKQTALVDNIPIYLINL